uniref:Uncharacterized protein n=1 Tax=Oryza sativa subsp. japonica TaxID=39947 RepID=Q5Z6D0_ORYSJ|nr:hypothetical protein [Oryza sativa Japonica Group]BAD61922.1 hypothetical protein [Oryza sativa Japonica Group]
MRMIPTCRSESVVDGWHDDLGRLKRRDHGWTRLRRAGTKQWCSSVLLGRLDNCNVRKIIALARMT